LHIADCIEEMIQSAGLVEPGPLALWTGCMFSEPLWETTGESGSF